jgi:predicted lipoprotein with Yx(FWY)xxD motif
MRTSMKFLIPLLGAAVLAGCGSSSKSSSSTSSAASAPAPAASGTEGAGEVVKSAANAKLGATILVDAHGMTLYSLSAERNGKFICTNSACLHAWHPLVAQAGSAPKASVGSLGTLKRPDGTEQVTYKGMPLYTFALDRAPGSVGGQGIKDVGTWQAVTTAAAAGGAQSPVPASTQATTSTTTTSPPASEGGGRYGY